MVVEDGTQEERDARAESVRELCAAVALAESCPVPMVTEPVPASRGNASGRSRPSRTLALQSRERLRGGGGGSARAALWNAARSTSSSSSVLASSSLSTITLPRWSASPDDGLSGTDANSHWGTFGVTNQVSASALDGSMRATAHSPFSDVMVLIS